MFKLKYLLHIDLLAATGALAWAIAAQEIEQLNNLVNYKAAFVGAPVALGRWIHFVRADLDKAGAQ